MSTPEPDHIAREREAAEPLRAFVERAWGVQPWLRWEPGAVLTSASRWTAGINMPGAHLQQPDGSFIVTTSSACPSARAALLDLFAGLMTSMRKAADYHGQRALEARANADDLERRAVATARVADELALALRAVLDGTAGA